MKPQNEFIDERGKTWVGLDDYQRLEQQFLAMQRMAARRGLLARLLRRCLKELPDSKLELRREILQALNNKR